MHYQKSFSTPYPLIGHLSHAKFYLQDGRTTKDTNGYLVLEISSKSYLQGGRKTKDIDGYLILEILRSLTYGMDGRPRIPTGTWS